MVKVHLNQQDQDRYISQRAWLNFPVKKVKRQLKKYLAHHRVQMTAAVYMAATLEYLSADVLEVAGISCRGQEAAQTLPKVIRLRHLRAGMAGDVELDTMLSNLSVPHRTPIPSLQSDCTKVSGLAVDQYMLQCSVRSTQLVYLPMRHAHCVQCLTLEVAQTGTGSQTVITLSTTVTLTHPGSSIAPDSLDFELLTSQPRLYKIVPQRGRLDSGGSVVVHISVTFDRRSGIDYYFDLLSCMHEDTFLIQSQRMSKVSVHGYVCTMNSKVLWCLVQDCRFNKCVKPVCLFTTASRTLTVRFVHACYLLGCR
jgi:histone H3/H4